MTCSAYILLMKEKFLDMKNCFVAYLMFSRSCTKTCCIHFFYVIHKMLVPLNINEHKCYFLMLTNSWNEEIMQYLYLLMTVKVEYLLFWDFDFDCSLVLVGSNDQHLIVVLISPVTSYSRKWPGTSPQSEDWQVNIKQPH